MDDVVVHGIGKDGREHLRVNALDMLDDLGQYGPPPSRTSNPFATCWTRPGALPFCFAGEHSPASTIAKLAAANWRGAIVGPHGSGKSTLLATLQPALIAARRQVHFIALHDSQRRLPLDFWPQLPQPNAALLIIDGYDQLSFLARWRLDRYCRRAKCGLLVTSHAKLPMPTLVRTYPDCALVQQLVAQLCQRVPSSISRQDITASHARHGSNVREIFFDLYDRHEQLRRINRTTRATAT